MPRKVTASPKPAPANSRAVGYILTGKDTEAANRREEIKAYCEARALVLTAIFEDAGGVSRTQLFSDRHGGAECLKAIKAGARHLVIPRLRSTFCSVTDAAHHLDRLRRYRKEVHFIHHPDKSFTTADDPARIFWRTLYALGLVDKFNVRLKMATSGADHKVMGFVRGAVPYGYDRHGSLLVDNDREQKVIERMRQMRAAGASYRDVTSALNADGVPSKKGARWSAITVSRVLNGLQRSMKWDMLADARRTDPAAFVGAPNTTVDFDKLWRPQDGAYLASELRLKKEQERSELDGRKQWRKSKGY